MPVITRSQSRKLVTINTELIDTKSCIALNRPLRSVARLNKNYIGYPLEGMDLSHYGRGFHLKASVAHPRYGQKYFYGGWWQPKNKAWFFKKNRVVKLICLGASTPDSWWGA